MGNDKQMRERIANFRYGLISEIVSRKDLLRGERAQILKEVASRAYQIPGSTRTRVSVRTLERYLALYQQGGLDALMPGPTKKGKTRIPQELIDRACALRRENPRRSVERIITMLEATGEAPEGLLKKSTLYDHLARAGLTWSSQGGTREKEVYRRFSAKRRNERWQGDVYHALYLPDPEEPGRRRKVLLMAWLDDYSRLCVHAQFYFNENLPALEDCLKKGIIKRGIPESLYADNGAIYSSHHLQRICGRLGIHLVHTRPYKPQGKGKMEKFLQLAEDSLLSELRLLVDSGELTTLDGANKYLFSWLESYYNERRHSATKQKPILRWESDTSTEIRRANLDVLNDAFLWEDERKVDKTGILSLSGNEYEVSTELEGQEVTVRYDPYDLSKPLQVYWEGKRYPDAIPATIHHHHHKEVKKTQPDEGKEPSTGLNFAKIIRKEEEKDLAQKRMTYSTIIPGKGEESK